MLLLLMVETRLVISIWMRGSRGKQLVLTQQTIYNATFTTTTSAQQNARENKLKLSTTDKNPFEIYLDFI
jgi:hypothetical protein